MTTPFGPRETDVAALLQDVAATLRSTPAALSSSLDEFDAAAWTVSSAQSISLPAAATENPTGPARSPADAEQIGPDALALRLTAADASYRSALETNRCVRPISLLDFLT